MNNSPLTLDDIRALASAIGLNNLSSQQLEQLRQVTNVKRSQDLTALMTGLGPADEPACTFVAAPTDIRDPA